MKPGSNGKARIFLADDHQMILDRAAELLDGKFELVGRAQDGKAALEGIALMHPDVLVVDIGMPVLDGLRVMKELKENCSSTKVVFLTVQEDSDYIDAAFRYGASAYVTKPRMNSDLVSAIDAVLEGRTFVSPSLALSTNGNGSSHRPSHASPVPK